MGDNDIELFDQIVSSNLQYREKSKILSLLDSVSTGPGNSQSLLGALVETTVAGTTGSILGVLQAELKDGLDYNRKYPIDLVLAALSGAGGHIYNSQNSRTVKDVAVGVYTFRKVDALLTLVKPKPSVATDEPVQQTQEQPEADPIAAAASGLEN